MIGSRSGPPTIIRRLVARAAANTLAAFVIPDARTARSMGLDLPVAGLKVVASPRHASVLVVIGHLPRGLSEAAAVVYAQMPRPRAILALSADVSTPLPNADVTTASNQAGLVDGVARIREHTAHRSWTSAPPVFTAPMLEGPDHDGDGMHQGHDMHAGMEHGAHEMSSHDHAAMPMHEHESGRAPSEDTGATTGEHEDGDCPDHESMSHGAMSSGDHAGMDHGDHMMMDHGSHGGFMSMIATTRDLPRSRDGLPMEWVETSFGPLFAGLPGGLAPTLTLDGDTVARARLTAGVTHRDIATSLRGPVATFPDRLAALDPLAPVAYRLLAGRALETLGGSATHDAGDHGWIGALERERAINHLGWLAAFVELLGAAWLATRAAELQLALVHAREISAVGYLRPAINRFLRDAGQIPLLSRRLSHIGVIDPTTAATARGPVARASGVVADARIRDPAYHALGFVSVLRHDGDALARLRVRVAEIGQSLDLVAAVNSLTVIPPNVSPDISGTGMASIETPRGAASLHIEVDHGHVRMAHVQTPSAVHVALLPRVTEGAELADALAGISSLDLSPWEIDQ